MKIGQFSIPEPISHKPRVKLSQEEPLTFFNSDPVTSESQWKYIAQSLIEIVDVPPGLPLSGRAMEL
ncbi:MAG: hypothetical protein ACTSU5_04780 [Promethearchaeota archaeon]